jgi:nucleoside phosphorylase
MNKSHLFLLATQLEAKPILEDQNWSWSKAEDQKNLFVSKKGDALLITGIGPTRTALSIGQSGKPFSEHLWVNMGVAGALNKHLRIGEIGKVSMSTSAFESHPFDRSTDSLKLQPDGWRCLTLGEALHNEKRKQELSSNSDIVDMELYALALAAKIMNSELRSYKIISDFSSEKDKDLIIKRIPEMMSHLWLKWTKSLL